MINDNKHKYSVSALCNVLQLSRSSYYYELNKQPKHDPDDLVSDIINIFHNSRGSYGSRRIKAALKRQGLSLSRRRIRKIMDEHGLTSCYTKAKFKAHKETCNQSKQTNVLDREFVQTKELHAVVSDLTYIKVGSKWHYACIFLDLFNREIIGYSVGPNKDAALVYRALASIKKDLRKIAIFHTDRGSEFDNKLIVQALHAFSIQSSLSKKGCPYDNAVAEATFKSIKTELIKHHTFQTITDLEIKFFDYVNWFNNHRLHSTLGYLSPMEYKHSQLQIENQISVCA